MSLISGLYFSGNSKQKPKQWGDSSFVSSVVADRMEAWYGIPWDSIVLIMPIWGPGKQRDYSKNNINLINSPTPPVFDDNALLFSGSQYIQCEQHSDLDTRGKSEFSILVSFKPTVSGYTGRILTWDAGSSEAYFMDADLAGAHTFYTRFHSDTLAYVVRSWSLKHNYTLGLCVDKNLNSMRYDDRTYAFGSVTSLGSHSSSFGTQRLWIGANDSTGNFLYGALSQIIISHKHFGIDIYDSFNDNPYGLWQPPTFRTYFDFATSSSMSITDTPYLTNIVSYQIASSEASVVLDESSIIVVNASQLLGIDAGTALDMAWIANATGLSINAFDQALAFDYSAFANASVVPIQCVLGNILYDSAQLANAVCVITNASGIAVANDICNVTPVASSALINAGYAVAFDASVMGLANGYVITGGDTGVSTDVAVLANASAMAISAMIGNSMLDAAMLAQAGVVILAVSETAIANGYGSMTAVPSVVLVSDAQASVVEASVMAGSIGWVIPGVEVLSVSDYAVLVASQGLAVSAFETLVLTDLSAITQANAWMLTAATNVTTHININAIFGTPVLVPVLSGMPVLQNKLQGTPLIIRS